MISVVQSGRFVAPITINSNWGETDCASSSSCTSTSATRTITGSGTIKMSFTNTYVCQYSKNAGAFTSFSNNATLAVANSDTLALKILSMGPSDGATITVTDNSTTTLVGTFIGANTAEPP